MPEFEDQRLGRNLLANQPVEVKLVCLARGALRAVPEIVHADTFSTTLILQLFRTSALSWLAACYPGLVAPQRAIAAADALRRIASAPVEKIADSRALSAVEACTNAALAAARFPIEDDSSVSAHEIAFINASLERPERVQRARQLLDWRLWPPEIARDNPAVADWRTLKGILSGGSPHWITLIEWYEDRLAGRASRPRLDRAIATLPRGIWDEGPASVDDEIRLRLSKEMLETLDPVPGQGAGLHFVFSATGQLELAPPSDLDSSGNHIARIRQLLPLARRTADDLITHLATTNAFPELGRTLIDYRSALSHEPEDITWGLVFGLGLMLENATEAAQRDIADRLSPSLEDAAQAALISLVEIHGPLILATAEGRELVDQADQMRLTRDAQRALRADAHAISIALLNATEVVTPRAAQVIEHATAIIGEGEHPERGTVYGLGTVQNVTIGFVGVAAVSAVFGVSAVSAAALFVALEGLKRSTRFSALTSLIGHNIDRALDVGPIYRRLVVNLQQPLRRIAQKTPHMRWMLSHIDAIASAENVVDEDP